MKFIKRLRKFKKKHKVLHIALVAVAVIFFWRGVWGIIDAYFWPDNLLVSHIISILVALLILYLDDFNLKELE